MQRGTDVFLNIFHIDIVKINDLLFRLPFHEIDVVNRHVHTLFSNRELDVVVFVESANVENSS